MSITQTYFLAHTARAKLSREAARPDHDLRLLVGHANMLDLLMLDLAEAEKEQERWFNQSIRGTSTSTSTTTSKQQEQQSQSRHIQWADRVIRDAPDEEIAVESEDEEWDASSVDDSDSDSDYENDDAFFVDVTPSDFTPLYRSSSTASEPKEQHFSTSDEDHYLEEEPELDDDEADLPSLALTRTHSHQHQPPELLHDESDSEEESLPPSPEQQTFDHFTAEQASGESQGLFYAAKQLSASTPTDSPEKMPLSATDQSAFLDDGYYIPAREQGTVIEAY